MGKRIRIWNRKQAIQWLLFGVIFIATQDYLFISDWSLRLLLGMPVWLYYFVLIHLVFIAAIFLFIRRRDSIDQGMHPQEQGD